jgi:hypothetical protein
LAAPSQGRQRPFLDVLYEMLDALAFGNKIAEQIYDLDRDDDGKPRLFIKALKIKPRVSTAFVVDAYQNVLGVLALLPGRGYPVVTGSVIGDPSKIPNLLPREKFAIFPWNAHDGDPRGTSLLRAVYNPWWLKIQVWGEYAKYLAQFAGPSLIGYTAPGQVAVPPMDALGNPIPGAPLITPEQAMLKREARAHRLRVYEFCSCFSATFQKGSYDGSPGTSFLYRRLRGVCPGMRTLRRRLPGRAGRGSDDRVRPAGP